ncbi:hypothetical protein YC2023_045195 [Brassica napus]
MKLSGKVGLPVVENVGLPGKRIPERAWRVARTPAFVAPVSLEYLFSSFELSSCCESLYLRCMDSSVSAASYLPLPVFYR